MYGETNQANYLINAKGNNSETKGSSACRQLFNDRTNKQAQLPEQPVSPFKDQSSKIASIRDSSYAPSSPVKSFDYRA